MLDSVFERTVIGFDLRRPTSLDRLFLTSYDEGVRYEEVYDRCQNNLSGINLFPCDPATIPSVSPPEEARVVAFDLPRKFVEYLSVGSVSNPSPLPCVGNSLATWGFMGFDVVDAITQTSALYGVDRNVADLQGICGQFNFHLNSHGLIDSCDTALQMAAFFDDSIAEHAPFAPCGVWLKPVSSHGNH